MNVRNLNLAAGVLLVSLIALCLLWEAWLAPLRPGGSWMTLKALPLMAALFGVLKGRRYTYQWLSMLVLLYLVEGVVRATDAGLTGILAIGEAVLSGLLFTVVLLYARVSAPSRQARPSS
ncbi:MAG TPA: DUF2069 domain-containing protein [Aromatoleum sp.]|uniref:DUF2069 domain-containing protein n=1 Tax=Aromatoleum sp. TaxID=2307007 RepID=UPI002B4A8E6C|nr:DUF2069 domain-containing protein [Aromatoleum sp.]HJV27236.1 DUF2069 domain-containing protein [Aromatoleum sp.]